MENKHRGIKPIYLGLVACPILSQGALGAGQCQIASAFLAEPGVRRHLALLRTVKTFGIPGLHKAVLLQKEGTNQLIVIMGEAHFKSERDSRRIEKFTKHFPDIAIELPGDQTVESMRSEFQGRTSNIVRALFLDSDKHSVHLVDAPRKGRSSWFINTALLGPAAILTLYLAHVDISIFTSGTVENFGHNLTNPPFWVSYPGLGWFYGMQYAALESTLGLTLNGMGKYRLASYLPVTNSILISRNLHMANKITELMNDPNKRREKMLVIVGRAHLKQVVAELENQGFTQVDNP